MGLDVIESDVDTLYLQAVLHVKGQQPECLPWSVEGIPNRQGVYYRDKVRGRSPPAPLPELRVIQQPQDCPYKHTNLCLSR
jgi:hypothetical protein